MWAYGRPMRYSLRQMMLAVLPLTVACGSNEPLLATQCLSVTVPPGSEGLVTGLPARVSLFFRVDTCGGAAVSGLDASHFEISEDGKAVSPYESERRIQAKGEKYRMNSIVLLDVSGSVLASGQFPQLKTAATTYVRRVLTGQHEGQRVSVMTFDGRAAAQVLIDFSNDVNAVVAALNTLDVTQCSANIDCAAFTDHRTCAGWRCVDNSTNLNGAVVQALDALDARANLEKSIVWKDSTLVLFTDGTDQAGRVQQLTAFDRARTSSTHIFSIGLGGEVDGTTLQVFGKDGYFPAAKADQLSDAFDAIAAKVTGLANRFYLLEYCSPKRSGTHTLKIVATNGDLVGGLSQTFDATGFTSGCELN